MVVEANGTCMCSLAAGGAGSCATCVFVCVCVCVCVWECLLLWDGVVDVGSTTNVIVALTLCSSSSSSSESMKQFHTCSTFLFTALPMRSLPSTARLHGPRPFRCGQLRSSTSTVAHIIHATQPYPTLLSPSMT